MVYMDGDPQPIVYMLNIQTYIAPFTESPYYVAMWFGILFATVLVMAIVIQVRNPY